MAMGLAQNELVRQLKEVPIFVVSWPLCVCVRVCVCLLLIQPVLFFLLFFRSIGRHILVMLSIYSLPHTHTHTHTRPPLIWSVDRKINTYSIFPWRTFHSVHLNLNHFSSKFYFFQMNFFLLFFSPCFRLSSFVFFGILFIYVSRWIPDFFIWFSYLNIRRNELMIERYWKNYSKCPESA